MINKLTILQITYTQLEQRIIKYSKFGTGEKLADIKAQKKQQCLHSIMGRPTDFRLGKNYLASTSF